jgi:hypothetical protein
LQTSQRESVVYERRSFAAALIRNTTMNDIEQSTDPVHLELSGREKQLQEKLGGRLLLIWLLGLVVMVQLLVIVHLAK